MLGLALSPDESVLASCSADASVRLWSMPEGRPLGTLQSQSSPGLNCVAFSSDGRALAAGRQDGGMLVWDVGQRQCTHIIQGRQEAGGGASDGGVRCLAFAPGSSIRLASGGSDTVIREWLLGDDGQTTCMHTYQGHSNSVRFVAYSSPDQLVSAGEDWEREAAWRLWDTTSGACTPVLPTEEPKQPTENLHLFADGSALLSGTWGASPDQSLDLWDVQRTAGPVGMVDGRTASIVSTWCGASAVAVSQDRRLAVTATWGELKLWDLRSGQCRGALQGHTAGVAAVVISPGCRFAASALHDGTVKVWQLGRPR